MALKDPGREQSGRREIVGCHQRGELRDGHAQCEAVNVRVINASWGYLGSSSPELRAAIAAAGEAGILFVAAAGNGDVFGRGIDNDAGAGLRLLSGQRRSGQHHQRGGQ